MSILSKRPYILIQYTGSTIAVLIDTLVNMSCALISTAAIQKPGDVMPAQAASMMMTELDDANAS